MKAYRISWHALVEDESKLDGRTIIYAETTEEAIRELIVMKTREYRLKSDWLRIESIYEMSNM